MGLAGKALVAIWNDIAPEMREDFFEWHPREHMVERLGIPGFLRGRRYSAVEADVEFLTLYELRDVEVLVSDVYKERLTNPTPWSTKTLPAFRNNVRGACRIHFSDGYAMGGFVHTVRLRAPEGQEGEVVQVLPTSNKVIVNGVNTAKKHSKARKTNQQGGIIDRDMPVDASNVMLVHKGKPTRVGYTTHSDGTKVRVAKRTGEVIS